ncbi:hypothetical protein OROGR_003128 [Orobanche gracilis]
MASSLSPPAPAPAPAPAPPSQGMAEKTKNLTGRHNHHPLQCPRCNSSNTKFCYYNNYSLSQPRHFCKACKRYWTRGGTLRNVPIGGGCRKNKRMNRPLPGPSVGGGDGVSSAATATATATATAKPNIDMSPASNHTNNSNPSFYTLNHHHHHHNNNQLELSFPFSGFGSTRARDNSNNNTEAGYDFQPPIINGLGLGFSSGIMANDHLSSTGNSSIFFRSSSSSTMASLLNSSFQQQRFGTNSNDISFKDMIINGGPPIFTPYDEETQMLSDQNGSVILGKYVKQGGENRQLDWNPDPNPNPFERMTNSSNDVTSSSSMIWNTTNLGAWFDPSNSNMDPSVPSL